MPEKNIKSAPSDIIVRKLSATSPEEAAFLELVNMVVINVGDFIDERYEVLDHLGMGAFACVYKVRQVFSTKLFALKCIAEVSANTIERLRKEARAVSRLDHPNLVRAVDFGVFNGVHPYLVLEYIEGPTLAEYLSNRSPLTQEESIEIFLPLCDALDHAHKKEVIHRDIKPANIALQPDPTVGTGMIPKLFDFGIAKTHFRDDLDIKLTQSGYFLGTPLYISPEQASTDVQVDGRADIYSLGCVMFEALTGNPPFSGANPIDVVLQQRSTPAPTLSQALPKGQFSGELEACIAKMLAKQPADRYQTAGEVAHDLRRLTVKKTAAKTPSKPMSRKMRGDAGASSNSERRRAFVVGTLCGIVLATIISVLLVSLHVLHF